MDQNFNKKLDEAIKTGQFDQIECNNDEERSLLEAGKKIYQVKFKQIPADNGFKNALFERLKQARQGEREKMENKIQMSVWTKMIDLVVRRKWAVGIASFLLLAIIVSLFYWLPGTKNNPAGILIPRAQAEEVFTFKPTKMDTAGIAAESDFSLASQIDLKLSDVEKNLVVDPKFKYEIKEISPREFLIDSLEKLNPNQIYKFTLKATTQSGANNILESSDFKWAYQTKAEFKIVSTIPADKSQDVPVNTGLEFNFSYPDFSGWEDKITFEPKLEGSWEKHNKVLVFVPKGNLQYGTLYKVTISKDLQVNDSDKKLDQDYYLAFVTESDSSDQTNQDYYFHYYKDMWSLSTLETQAISFSYDYYGDDQEKNNNLPVKVYQFADKDKFLAGYNEKNPYPGWAYWSNERMMIDTSDLKDVLDFTATPDEYDTQQYFVMPTSLDTGFYLVEVDLPGNKYQTFLQITNLGCYTALSETKSMMWCFDLDTKQAAAGAKVELAGGGPIPPIDNQGVTTFDTPSVLTSEVDYDTAHPKNNTQSDIQIFTVTYQDKLLLIPTVNSRMNYFNYDNNRTYQEDFWSYFYKDRTTYQSNDTIKIWGYIKPRDANTNINGQLQIALTSQTWNEPATDYVKQDITLKADHTFTTELPIKQIKPGYYAIQISDQKGVINTGYVNIENYSVSPYKITLQPEKNAVRAGETVKVKVKTQYFDGTPAPFSDFSYEYNTINDQILLKNQTDLNGEIELEVPTVKAECDQQSDNQYLSCYYHDVNLSAYPSLLSESESMAATDIKVFDTDLDLKVDSTKNEEGNPQFTVDAKKIDLTKINAGEIKDGQDFGFEAASNATLNLKLTEEYWEKTQDGEVYDFVKKKKVPTYKYDRKTNLTEEIKVQSDENGQYVYQIPNYDSEKSYYLTVTAADENGDLAGNYGYYSGIEYDYSISDDLILSFDKSKYKLDDQVMVGLDNKDKSELPTGKGIKYLFFQAQRGIRDYSIEDKPKYSFTFEEKDLPAVYLGGVEFSGYGFRENLRITGSSGMVKFDSQEKELKFDLTTDKNEYKPGDEVKLTINVKNQNNQPIQTSGVLSVVDEAYLYLFENVANPLYDLYDNSNVSSGLIDTYTSHEQLAGLSKKFGGGMGAGGGGGMRADFKDTAYFGAWTSNAKGETQVNFKLPDNITSWRASVLAINDDVSSGIGSIDIVSTLPIMANANFAKTYLQTDKPIIQVRADGTALNQDDQATFEIEIPDWKIKESFLGKVFANNDWKMPDLKTGDTKVIVRVKDGQLEDAREYTIKVMDSYWRTKTIETRDLTETLASEQLPADSRTELKFFNQPIGLAYDLSNQLAWQDGERLDQKLGRNLSQQWLKDYFGENFYGEENTDFNSFTQDDGGLSLLPYSSSDLPMSALAAGAGSDLLNKSDLSNYFAEKLNNKNSNLSELVWVVYGLASLDQPVLNYANSLYREKELTVDDRLVLALAMNKMGAQELAKSILKNILENNSSQSGPYIMVTDDKDPENVLETTAWAAILAYQTDGNQATDLWGYVENKADKDHPLFLEKALLAKSILEKEKNYQSSFTYSLSGTNKNVKLGNDKSFTLDLTRDEIANLKFSNIVGKIKVAISYDKSGDAAFGQNPDLQIKREYLVNGNQTDTFQAGDLVEVRLYPQIGDKLPEGTYQIRDILPSGLKVATDRYQPSAYSGYTDCSVYYPYDYNGQEVNLLINKDFKANYCNQDYISYFARMSNTGEFQTQPLSLFMMDNPNTVTTTPDPGKITIK